jgi:pantothenate kinase-related protein Tda10
MNLIISCELTAPPSEVSAFRSLTMYATIFKKMDCLIEADPEEIDFYYTWLKRNYAHDFIRQFVRRKEVTGVEFRYDSIQRITHNNLNELILAVNTVK